MGWFTPNKNGEAAITDSEWIPTVTISPHTGVPQHTWVGSNTASNITWTHTNTGGWGAGSGTFPGTYQVNTDLKGGQLYLEGDGADIHINGESLMKTLQVLEQRLNILRPNTELEAEWDQLRALSDQYRELEAQLLEKQKMWDRLKTK